MSSQVIDEKIVRLKMDYSSVEKGAGRVTSTLGRIADSIRRLGTKTNTADVAKSISDIGSKASLARPLIDQLGDAATNVGNKFSVLKTVAVGALMRIGSTVAQKASQLLSAFTTDPIRDGFGEYEEKLKSIQTILANTTKDGTTLAQVNKELNALNAYADKTVYSFADMTKNIGLFTNAGLGLTESTSMIKGWSNAVAGAGGNAEDASRGAYQLSQELAQGRMTLMGWNSMVNAKAGNNNMKAGLIDIAKAMGKFNGVAEKNIPTMDTFRDTLQDGWLTTDITSAYLRIMAGDMDDAGMAALGLSADQIKAFKAQQKAAEEAATKVRSFTQLMGTLKEAVGSGWATTWELLLGDFNDATKLFSGIADSLSTWIGKYSDARNNLLKAAVKLGARDDVLSGLKAAFQALAPIVKTLAAAFRQVFPPTTAEQIKSVTGRFKELMEGLKPSAERLAQFKNIFTALFTIVKAGITVIGMAGKLLAALIPDNLFDIVMNVTNKIAEFILKLSSGAAGMKDFASVTDTISKVMNSIGESINMAIDKFKSLGSVVDGAKTILVAAMGIIGTIAESVWNTFSKFNFKDLFNVAAIGAVGVTIAKISKTIKGFMESFDNISSIGGSVSEAFESVTDAIQTMTLKVKSEALMNIAIAIGILSAALFVLSTIDSVKLGVSLGAVASNLAILMAGLNILGKTPLKTGSIMASVVAMTVMASALLILATAVKIMSTMKPAEMAQGLLGITAGMVIMVKAVQSIGDVAPKAIIAASAMSAMATALILLTVPIMLLGRMDTADLAKGIAGVGAALAILVVAVRSISKLGPSVIVAASSMTMIATALNLLIAPILVFSRMSWEEIAKGLATTAAALIIMSGGLALISKISGKAGMVLGAASMIMVATAITILAGALRIFGGMSVAEIAKGLGTLAGSLVILAVGLKLMQSSLAGALALTIVANAMIPLATALRLLGSMDITSVATALGTLAGTLLIFTVAAYALQGAIGGVLLLGVAALELLVLASAVAVISTAILTLAAAVKVFSEIPLAALGVGLLGMAGGLGIIIGAAYLAGGAALGLLSLGAAFILIGSTIALVGIGVKQMADGLMTLSKIELGNFADNLSIILETLATLIPKLIKIVTDAIADVLKSLASLIPGIVNLGKALLEGIMALIPTFIKMLSTVLTSLQSLIPQIISLFVAMASGILQALMILGPQVIALFTVMLSYLIMSAQIVLPQLFALFGTIITGVLTLLVNAVPQMAAAAMSIVLGILQVFADSVTQFVTIGLQIITGFLNGIAAGIPGIVVSVTNIIVTFLDSIASQIPRIVDSAMNLILSFINALADATEVYGPQITSAIQRLLTNVINIVLGLVGAMASAAFSFIGGFIDMAVKVASTIWGRLSGFFAPLVSRVVGAIGSLISTASNFIQGFIRGAVSVAGGIWNAISGFFTSIPGKIAGAIGNLYDSGASVISGFVSGLTSGLESAKRKVSGALSSIRGLFPFSPAKEGPFSGRGWVTYSGKSILPAFTKGLVQNVGDSVDKTKNAMGKIREALSIDDYKLPALQGIDLSGTARVYTNQVVEGSATFETKLLDKFNKLKEDISDAFNDSIDNINDRAIVVENYMDKTKVGEMVAQPVKETNEKRQRIIDAVSGKGVN